VVFSHSSSSSAVESPIVTESIRECGSCSACCTVLGVHEIEKGIYDTCRHVCESGCAIHAERPGSCRSFECQWLRGVLEVDGGIDAQLRPDVCGVIFDYQPHTAFGEMFTVWEVEPGASTRDEPRRIVEGLAEWFLVMTVTRSADQKTGPAERRFAGPRHLVSRASDAMWSREA